MKRRNYCCDASRDLYQQYYSRQNGGEIPPFIGRRYQRGHGLGNLLGGLLRNIIIPFGKSLLPDKKVLVKGALRTGSRMVGDLMQGQSIKQTALRRVPEGIKDTFRDITHQSAPVVEQKKKKKRRPVKRRRRDIFA